MPAYIIARVDVTDPEKYQGYKERTPAAVAKFGVASSSAVAT